MHIAKLFRKSGDVMKPPIYVILRNECDEGSKKQGRAQSKGLNAVLSVEVS